MITASINMAQSYGIVQAWHVIADKAIKPAIQFRFHLQCHNKVSPIGNTTHHVIQ